ncbi:hypothetical protein [Neorhizobium sp. S3-V5DH]|jgi:hypothetical protein|uniref:hypothetical protein n=1 Tax=Neorhizobium sp. S3-V5DH TaxID=2485166 RepID=UPI00104D2EAA|nr:hypothetical protein [Neorhizobium sp. S3-V5DH]TCV65350.1 hypothetical protein EDE09_12049 [Neorhizobium sp. S3-V5DH]
MEWEIVSFVGMGPIRFGMSPEEVAGIVGPPDRSRRGLRPGTFNEFRGTKAPIVRYNENRVREIEAFYDLESVTFQGIDLFHTNGIEVLRRLEELNGDARLSVGIILFDKLGLTAGRLDEGPRTGHSVTAFSSGTWDGKMGDFESISFK